MLITKTKILLMIFIISSLFALSAYDNRKLKESKALVSARRNGNYDNNKNEKDAQFLIKAAEISNEEIILGRLAQQCGSTAQVKELGKMMEEVYTKASDNLIALAKVKRIFIPISKSNKVQYTYDILNTKSGNDFDRAYTEIVVTGHNDAISVLKAGYIGSIDFDIRAWVASTLLELRTHQKHSQFCQEGCSKL